MSLIDDEEEATEANPKLAIEIAHDDHHQLLTDTTRIAREAHTAPLLICRVVTDEATQGCARACRLLA